MLSSSLPPGAPATLPADARQTWLRGAIGVLAVAVALAGTITAGASATADDSSAIPEQATLTLVLPEDADPGQTVPVTVLAEGLTGAVAVQATLRHDPGLVATQGARWEAERLSSAAGALRSATPVITPESTTVAAWSCTSADCLASAPPVPAGQFELLTAEIEVGETGSLEVALDDVVLVDADGQPLPVTVRVDGDSDDAEQPGPVPPAKAPDLNGDGLVDRQDAGEAEAEWYYAVEAGAACEQDGHPADANGDGCLDVRDLQAYDRALSEEGTAAPEDAATASAPTLGSWPALSAPASAAPVRTFVVDSTGDQDDASSDDSCRTSVGTCTLRAALTEARRVGGHDLIRFNLSGPGPHVLTPATRLPYLSDPAGVTIDGYSQPGSAPNTAASGSNADLRIALVGKGGSSIDGLVMPAPGANNVLRGLSLRQFRRTIWMQGADVANNKVLGSFVGISPDGSGGAASYVGGSSGINMQNGARDNVIGTPNPADRNVISGNFQHGVALYDGGTTRNTIQNNVVGLSPTGNRAVGNASHGIDINTWTTDTLVGGPGPNEANVVSGNNDEGIEISHGRGTLRNRVVGNSIGTAVDGQTAARYTSNGDHGVRLEGWGSCNPCPRDAGESEVLGNTIVGQGLGAVLGDKGFHSSVIAHNRIGLLPDGTVAGAGRFGVQLNHGAMDFVVRDNIVTGVENGLQVTGVGYQPSDPHPVDTFGHTFSRNSVYGISPGLGIDLAPFGTVNTAANAEATANRAVLAPRLTSVTAGAAAGTACGSCTVEVFEADRPAGHVGSGRRLVSTTTAAANGSFTAMLDTSVQQQSVTATATLPTGDTSEFARNVAVPPPATGNVTPQASFTSACTHLSCSFDGTGSSDPDGSLVGYSWDFGDGNKATGANPKHEYAEGGIYRVTLTVTDNQAATGQTSSTVAPSPPPAGLLASDTFERNVASGWGAADIGGSYTHFNGSAPLSVNGGTGVVESSSGNNTRSARLPVDARDVDMRVTLSADQVPTGSGHSAYLVGRAVANNTEYRVRLRFSGNNLGYLTVMKVVAPDFERAIGNEVAVPGLTHAVNTPFVLRASISGADPTTIQAKAWRAGSPEPAAWQLTRTDGERVLQAAGGAGVRTYVPTSMTNLPVRHRLDDFAVTDGSPPPPPPAPPPPANKAPVAAFTWKCASLDCSFDGTGSQDSDGEIASYAWDFGDGTTGTGVTASHTYAEPGTYPATLVVTDDGGATDSASTVVQVTAPPMKTLATDSFGRSVSSGWGDADTGGRYGYFNGSTGMSVSHGSGLVRSSSSGSRAARLPLDARDVDLRVTTSGDRAPTGSGYATYLLARSVGGNTEYRIRLRFAGGGQGYVTVMKSVSPSAEVAIGNEVRVPGLTYAENARYVLRASLVGTDPTALSAKAWRVGEAEPAEWQVRRVDSEPVLQARGGIGIRTFVAGTMTDLPLTHRIENLVVLGR